MKIAICDDDLLDLHYVQSLILEYDSSLDITLFQSANELLSAFDNYFYDIVFMDIEMEHPNGFEISMHLVQQQDKPLIIFVTNSSEYTIRGYGVAFRYMTKPLSLSALSCVLSSAIDTITPQKITVYLTDRVKYISICDIYYAEANGHSVILHTKNGPLKCRCQLKEIEKQLPVNRFSRSHNSFVINLNEVESSNRTSLILTDGSIVPISQRYAKIFNTALIQYIRRC